MSIVIGIDPGSNGGIALLFGEAIALTETLNMANKTDQEMWRFIEHGGHQGATAWLEKVAARPGQGVTSMFTFGVNYGLIRAWIVAADMRRRHITPAKWQREFSLPTLKDCGYDKNKHSTRGPATTIKKKAHKDVAQELFPTIKVIHNIADALLIAEYGRRIMGREAGGKP